jgi:mannose/fructose/N-acetylgalactosamine-specific phosphotransferase system component IIC
MSFGPLEFFLVGLGVVGLFIAVMINNFSKRGGKR